MKRTMILLIVLGGVISTILTVALASAPPATAPSASVDGPGAVDEKPVLEPANGCLVWARAHPTRCTNATDCSPSWVSAHLCGDGCGPTYQIAAAFAAQALASQVCLGPQCGCCEYVVDQDFSYCGTR